MKWAAIEASCGRLYDLTYMSVEWMVNYSGRIQARIQFGEYQNDESNEEDDFGQAIVFRDEKWSFKYVLKVGLPGISKILDTYYEKKVILE